MVLRVKQLTSPVKHLTLRVKQAFMTPMAYHIFFTRKTIDFTRKTLDFTSKTFVFTRKTIDFTRKTFFCDTNGLP